MFHRNKETDSGGSAKAKKYVMPIGEFVQRIKETKDSDLTGLAQKGKDVAKTNLESCLFGRVFNGYETVTFASENFVTNQLAPLLKKLQQNIEQDRDEHNLKFGKYSKNTKLTVEEIHRVVIDYLCSQFLNKEGELEADVAETVLGIDDEFVKKMSQNTKITKSLFGEDAVLGTTFTEIDLKKKLAQNAISSLLENMYQNIIEILEMIWRKQAKLTEQNNQEFSALSSAIEIYLIPEPTDEVLNYLLESKGCIPEEYIEKYVKQREAGSALKKAKEQHMLPKDSKLNEKVPEEVKTFYLLSSAWPAYPGSALIGKALDEQKDILRTEYAKHFNTAEKEAAIRLLKEKNKDIPSLIDLRELPPSQRRLRLKNAVDEELFKKHDDYQAAKTDGASGEINIAVSKFRSNFKEDKENDNDHTAFRSNFKEDKKNDNDHTADFIAERIEHYKTLEEGPKSFSEGLTGWKEKALWWGVGLLLVGAAVATAGALLPVLFGAGLLGAAAAPMVAGGVIAAYAGATSMGTSILANGSIRERYRSLSFGWKGVVLALSTIAILGLTVATGGLALGVFAGIGFGAAVTTLATASIFGSASGAVVGSAVVKAVASPVIVGMASHRLLSSNASMQRQLAADASVPASVPVGRRDSLSASGRLGSSSRRSTSSTPSSSESDSDAVPVPKSSEPKSDAQFESQAPTENEFKTPDVIKHSNNEQPHSVLVSQTLLRRAAPEPTVKEPSASAHQREEESRNRPPLERKPSASGPM
jgi:hypothetical protein